MALVRIQNACLKCAACVSLEIQDAKMTQKNRHLRTIAQLCRAVSSQLRHVLTIRKKNLLNSNISSTRPHSMTNFGPLTAEIGSGVWGTPANFNGFRVLLSLLQRRRSPEANQTLHNFFPSPGLIHCIRFRGPTENFAGAKFTLHPSLAFAYIGSITTWRSSSGR